MTGPHKNLECKTLDSANLEFQILKFSTNSTHLDRTNLDVFKRGRYFGTRSLGVVASYRPHENILTLQIERCIV